MAVSDLDLKPSAGMVAEAKKGLEWRREHGRGGTAVGIARARDIANGADLSPDTVMRMASFFARHAVDKKGKGFGPGEDGFPSNGRIAWALWGGDAGASWAEKKANQIRRERGARTAGMYATNDLVTWEDDDGGHLGEVMDVAFDGLEPGDVPVYKVKVYEYEDGQWVPRRVVVVNADTEIGSAYADYDDMDDMDDESDDCACGGGCTMCHPERMVASPLYGRAVMLAAARQEAAAYRASLVYRSVSPLVAGDHPAHTAAFGRLGRMLSPAELRQRREAARSRKRRRKSMVLQRNQMLEDRRRVLRRQQMELKAKRKQAARDLRAKRRQGHHLREAGRNAAKAMAHEFQMAGDMVMGTGHHYKMAPLVQATPRARRGSLGAERLARIASLAGRSV